jgi:hypothetical protein
MPTMMYLAHAILAVLVAVSGAQASEGRRDLPINPSFEQGGEVPEGWERANGAGTVFLRDGRVARTGRASACMQISSEGAREYPAFKCLVQPVRTGEEYSAGAWVRTRGMTDLGGYVVLEFFKAGSRLSFVSSSFTGAGDHDWRELTVRGMVPEGADAMRLGLVAHGQGHVWFDDASLVRTLEAPAEFDGDAVRLLVRPDRVLCDSFQGFGAQGDFFLTRDFNVKLGVTPQDIALVQGRVKAMRPHLMRLFFDYKWWEPQEGRQTPDSEAMRDFTGWIRFLKEIGTAVLLCPWGDCFAYSDWMNPQGSKLPAPGKAGAMVRSLADLIEFLRGRQGLTNVRYVNLMNEPDNDGARYPSVDEFVRLNRLLHTELVRRGLRDQVRLLGVDGCSWESTRPGEWYYEVLKRGTEYLDGVTCHTYGHKYTPSLTPWIHSRTDLLANAKGYEGRPVPFLITEFSTYGDTFKNPENQLYEHGLFLADFAITALRERTACILVWCLFDTYYSDNPEHCQRYGLWRYRTEHWEPRPGFYSWSLISRYTRPASRVVAVECEPAAPSVRAVGLISPSGELTFLVVNRYKRPIRATVEPNLARQATLRVYTYAREAIASAGGRMIGSSQTLAVPPAAQIKHQLEPESFVLLTELP